MKNECTAKNKKLAPDAAHALLTFLPQDITDVLDAMPDADEVRIKRGGRVFIRRDRQNIPLDRVMDDAEFDGMIDRLCRGSYHAYAEDIKRGSVSPGGGVRVGLCGRAVCDGREIASVYPIESVSVRIPHILRGVCGELLRLLQRRDMRCNILIYAPPGEGKTTLLRDIILTLSEAPYYMRMALIDTRGEISVCEMDRRTLVCVYRGYPADKAVVFALRGMSPDVIVLDEISEPGEADAVAMCRGAGCGVIATAHAGSVGELMSRRVLGSLCAEGAFDLFAGIKRGAGGRYIYTVSDKNGRAVTL